MKKIILIITVIFLLLTPYSKPQAIKAMTQSMPESGINSEPENNLNSALTFVKDMGTGINIGNTLDAIGTNTWYAGETGWGNPEITRELITAIKNYGYKTIRLPVTWAEHMGPAPDYTIENERMDRVEEVVNWILDEGLFCILNIHHDGGEADKSWILPAADNPERTANQFAAVWRQIARRFSGHSKDKLIFESMNEVGFDKLFNRYGGSPRNKSQAYNIFNMLNQTFLDTVRVSGGANTERYLLIAGYWTDIDLSCDTMFKMPKDTIADRLMLSVHYYTPSTFCIAEERNNSWGFRDTWGTNADYAELNNNLRKLKTNFVDKGIPVIMGEYGVTLRNKNEASRVLWMTEVIRACLNNNVCPILWDTGDEIDRYPPYTMRDSLRQVWASF